MNATQSNASLEPYRIADVCPCCRKPLWAIPSFSNMFVTVYCGYGPCGSQLCNEGAIGITLANAVKNLDVTFETILDDDNTNN